MFYRYIFIILFIIPKLSFSQFKDKRDESYLPFYHYIKPKYKIRGEDFSVFVIAHGTLISAPTDILPKGNGNIFNLGLGTSLKVRINQKNSIKTELSFIQKGSSYSFGNRETIRLRYLEIPLLWSHSWSHLYFKGKRTFFFECGFAFSTLLLSSRQIANYAELSQITNSQNFRRIDVPMIISIKTPLYSMSNKKLMLGFRFSYSPMSIHDEFKTLSMWKYLDDGMHHMTYGIQLDYIFRN